MLAVLILQRKKAGEGWNSDGDNVWTTGDHGSGNNRSSPRHIISNPETWLVQLP
jgi:hypothetical protein